MNQQATRAKGIDLDLLYNGPERQRILIVDDDPDTVQLLKEILRSEGFDVYGANNRDEAIRKTGELPPHLILLDLMMPDHDGWETFDSLRDVSSAPVIVISAKDNKDDIVHGLQLGVDDYMTKPFFNAEVIARVRTVLRRAPSQDSSNHYSFPEVGLEIDQEHNDVSLHGEPVHLTHRELAVLACLASHAPKSVTHATIAKEVWGEDSPQAHKRIKYLIYLLRKKLEADPGKPALILNNEAFGYRLQPRRID